MSTRNPYEIDEAYGIRQLGEIVRHARRDAGLSQHALAALVRVDQSLISKLESGKLKGLRLRRLGAIIGVLEGRVEFWLGLRARPAGRRLPRDPAERDPD